MSSRPDSHVYKVRSDNLIKKFATHANAILAVQRALQYSSKKELAAAFLAPASRVAKSHKLAHIAPVSPKLQLKKAFQAKMKPSPSSSSSPLDEEDMDE